MARDVLTIALVPNVLLEYFFGRMFFFLKTVDAEASGIIKLPSAPLYWDTRRHLRDIYLKNLDK